MKKEDASKKIAYIKVKSAKDLARMAFSGDFSSRSLLSSDSGGRHRLMLLGEQIADTVLAYYCETDSKSRGLLYSGGDSADSAEKVDFYEKDPGMEKGFLDIFDVDITAFANGKIDVKSVSLVRVKSTDMLVKMAIKSAVKEESIRQLYLFSRGGRQALGGFDLIDELNDDKRSFYYSFPVSIREAAFAKYDYKSGRVEFSDRIGEYSYMFLKIINLAEPFPFFKVPD